MRVSFIAAYAAPFHVPGLNALADRCDLSILYVDETRSHDVSHRHVTSQLAAPTSIGKAWHIQLDRSDLNVKLSIGASRWLRKRQPEVALVLGYVPAVWEALAWIRMRRVPMTMWSESSAWTGSVRSRSSQAVRRRLVKTADTQLSNGSQATEFLETLGYPPERIVESAYPIVTPPFDIGDLSRRSGPLRVLYAGRLIERKRPLDLLAAVSAAESQGVEATVRLAGDGPLADEVASRSQDLNDVELLGRLDRAQLDAQYRWADVVVVPSAREVWGLVVNEALASGAFVISSNEVASSIDLIPDPSCGVRYPVGDIHALAAALSRASTDLERSGEDRAVRRQANLAHAPSAYDPAVWADNVMTALRMAQAR